MNKEILAGTNSQQSTKDDSLHVCPACIKHNIIGSLVRFYDCDRANKDRNYSGEAKYYSIGMIINRRITDRLYISGIELGGDDVVDIRLPDGRISNGHFINGVSFV